MALTYHGDNVLSDSVPVLGYAGQGTCSILRREVSGWYRPGFRAEERVLKRYLSWSVQRVRVARRSGEGWAAHRADGNCWMPINSSSWNQSNGRGRRDADRDEVGSAGVCAREQNCKACGNHEVAASEDREVPGGQASAGVRLCVPERGSRMHDARRQQLGWRSRDTPINNDCAGEAGKPLH